LCRTRPSNIVQYQLGLILLYLRCRTILEGVVRHKNHLSCNYTSVVSYYIKAVCPNLFTQLPNVLLSLNFNHFY
jgi:hypothetical protein